MSLSEIQHDEVRLDQNDQANGNLLVTRTFMRSNFRNVGFFNIIKITPDFERTRLFLGRDM
jgi:hypothetical protein